MKPTTQKNDPQRIMALLKERAAALATVEQDSQDDQILFASVIVGAGQEFFALPAGNVREIILCQSVAQLPLLPDWILGITQIRGEVLAVVQLSAWFGIERNREQTKTLFAVVESGEDTFCLEIDSVTAFREIGDHEFKEQVSGDLSSARPIKGITSDGVSVIDMEKMFTNCRTTLAKLVI